MSIDMQQTIEANLLAGTGPIPQRTLRHAIGCVGVGRHSGARVALTLHPAGPGSGIRFRRTDRAGAAPIAATPGHLVVNDLALVLGAEDGSRVASIEHVMAALALTGIDNALIELNGPEVPAMDGSAQPFVFLIECAGATPLDAPRAPLAVPAPVELRAADGWARLAPASAPALTSLVELAGQGSWTHRVALCPESLRQELAGARYAIAQPALEAARERGLSRGVSTKNAVLLDDGRVVNEDGLRCADEPARHANLVALGALALLGGLPPVELATARAGMGLLARLVRAAVALPAEPDVPAPDAALARQS